MPYENWGKITFQDWTFYIQFWDYPYTGKAEEAERCFSVISVFPPPFII